MNDNLSSEITALRLLPILLSDKNKTYLYKIYLAETDKEVIMNSGPQMPHVDVLGHISEKGLFHCCREGWLID